MALLSHVTGLSLVSHVTCLSLVSHVTGLALVVQVTVVTGSWAVVVHVVVCVAAYNSIPPGTLERVRFEAHTCT